MKALNENCYDGKRIFIEETPQGCLVYDKVRKDTVFIGDLEDINALIGSLELLKKVWYEE
ncbi:MAG: hypothetical protein RR959_07930 [Erysipelotrichaceae bacterium]